MAATAKGKKPMKAVVDIVMPSDSDEESDEFEIDAPISQSVQRTARAVSTSSKQKIEELVIPETESDEPSNSEIDSADEDNETMEMDMPEVQVKVERPVRTTSSTSVKVIESTLQPPSKKVKIEQNEASSRASSQALTSSTSGSETIETARKTRKKYGNNDLPVSNTDPRWLRDYLNTVILWAGSQRGWDIPRPAMIKALQSIFDTVFPEISYDITANSAVFAVTSQRLSEWRSNIGSTALALVIDFCSRAIDFESNEPGTEPLKPKDIADQLLTDLAFVYEDSDNPSKETVYHSSFILQMIASTHLNAISAYVDVPALRTKELAAGKGMEGVILLCVIALERGLTFVRDETIDVNEVIAQIAAGGKYEIKLPKVLNPGTGKSSNRPYQFNEANWKDQTRSYQTSLYGKGDDTIRKIIAAAAELVDKTRASSGTSCGDTEPHLQVDKQLRLNSELVVLSCLDFTSMLSPQP
ncbi:hypothetical protein BJ138DRAFT_1120410 [Hygrophoropsis aurantiaca]|uniref:Uncharacterized protein n=1 Tax=Hygrophoropsis aurantiaca TaxID=72124 RepID=A0ACB7ZQB8_9AGAM|nr:hypothetical protein BJ138DRAFT_1120410 [Hygrophoropsis aurantiaca]